LITDNKNREITLNERQSLVENRESLALRNMDDLRATIASLEEQLRTAAIEAEEKLSSALEENKKAEAEVLRLLNVVKALEVQLEGSVAEMSSSRTESVIERKEHQRVVLSERDLTNRCSQLEKEKMALIREIGGASTKVVDSEREIDRLLATIANSKSDLDCLQHEMSSFKDAATAEAEGLRRLLEESKERLRDSERATLLMTGDSVDKLAQFTKVCSIFILYNMPMEIARSPIRRN
jgi:predicted  nucleic acid-binding Zn-ribbon protein